VKLQWFLCKRADVLSTWRLIFGKVPSGISGLLRGSRNAVPQGILVAW
jgi:hypothetical protein